MQKLLNHSGESIPYIYEKLAAENAKKSEKSVQECASYIGLVQKVLSDCQSVQKGLEDAVDDKIHIHTEDYNNPHEVTAEQIGTYTKSEIDNKNYVIQSDLNNYYTKTQIDDKLNINYYTKSQIRSNYYNKSDTTNLINSICDRKIDNNIGGIINGQY